MTNSNLPAKISLWRRIFNRLMTILIIAAVVLAIVPLIYILADVAISGASVISLSFLTHLPTAPNLSGGGIGPMLVGSFIMVGLAALVSIPIGVGAGVFFSEWPSSEARNSFRFHE